MKNIWCNIKGLEPIKNNKGTVTTKKSINNRDVSDCHVHWFLVLIAENRFLTSIISTQIKHPIAIGILLLIQTTIVRLIRGTIYKRFWFSYILFIIIIGGILVLFIYITGLASNEIFSPSNKILIITLITLPILTLIIPNITNNKEINTHEIIIENEIITTTTVKYNQIIGTITTLLVLYMLITLIINDAFAIAHFIPPGMTKKNGRDGVGFCKKQSLPYFKVLYHPTPAACEETKRTGRERKEKRAAMEGALCTENRIWDHRIRSRSANHYTASFVTWLPVQSYRSKRPPSSCTTLQHGTGVWKRVRSRSSYTVLESSEPCKETHNLVTTSRSKGLPYHGFSAMRHANKTPDSSVSTLTRLRWHDRECVVSFKTVGTDFYLPSTERLRQLNTLDSSSGNKAAGAGG